MKVEYDGKEIILYPTRTCFSDVIDYVNEHCGPLTPDGMELFASRHRICHGIMINEDGKRYSHAWIERNDGFALHSALIAGKIAWAEFHIPEYRKEMRVIEMTAYTVQECITEERKAGRPGPWKRQYYRLCRDFKRRPSLRADGARI